MILDRIRTPSGSDAYNGLTRRGCFSMDLEQYAKKVRAGDKGAALDALARSEDAGQVLAGLDRAKLEKAAKAGDMQALGQLLQGVLATPEGRRFAAQVQKAVGQNGR